MEELTPIGASREEHGDRIYEHALISAFPGFYDTTFSNYPSPVVVSSPSPDIAQSPSCLDIAEVSHLVNGKGTNTLQIFPVDATMCKGPGLINPRKDACELSRPNFGDRLPSWTNSTSDQSGQTLSLVSIPSSEMSSKAADFLGSCDSQTLKSSASECRLAQGYQLEGTFLNYTSSEDDGFLDCGTLGNLSNVNNHDFVMLGPSAVSPNGTHEQDSCSFGWYPASSETYKNAFTLDAFDVSLQAHRSVVDRTSWSTMPDMDAFNPMSSSVVFPAGMDTQGNNENKWNGLSSSSTASFILPMRPTDGSTNGTRDNTGESVQCGEDFISVMPFDDLANHDETYQLNTVNISGDSWADVIASKPCRPTKAYSLTLSDGARTIVDNVSNSAAEFGCNIPGEVANIFHQAETPLDILPHSAIIASRRKRSQKRSSQAKISKKEKGTNLGTEPTNRKIVRTLGPCALCREGHSRCNYPWPCKGCILRARLLNAVNAQALAERLCYKYDTKISQIREGFKGFFDFAHPSVTMTPLDSIQTSRHVVTLTLPPVAIDGKLYPVRCSKLWLEVEDCLAVARLPPGRGFQAHRVAEAAQDSEMLKAFLKHNPQAKLYRAYFFVSREFHEEFPSTFEYVTCESENDFFVEPRVVEATLPADDVLAEWGASDFSHRAEVYPNSFTIATDSFFHSYLNHKPRLPLSDVVECILKISALSRYVERNGLIDDHHFQNFIERGVDNFQQSDTQPPRSIRRQLSEHAGRAIESHENRVLKGIDDLMFNKKRGREWQASCSDPVVLGYCIRRLSLHYRHSMCAYRSFGRYQSHRYKRCRTMYDASIRHFAHAFRGSLSPFHPDWRIEDHKSAFGNDADIIAKFEYVKKCEELHFRGLDDDDGVYRGLFAEKKDKQHWCPAKTWCSRESSK